VGEVWISLWFAYHIASIFNSTAHHLNGEAICASWSQISSVPQEMLYSTQRARLIFLLLCFYFQLNALLKRYLIFFSNFFLRIFGGWNLPTHFPDYTTVCSLLSLWQLNLCSFQVLFQRKDSQGQWFHKCSAFRRSPETDSWNKKNSSFKFHEQSSYLVK